MSKDPTPTEHDDAAPGSVLAAVAKIRDDIAAEGEPLVIALVPYGEKIALRFDYPEEGFGQIRRALVQKQTQGRRGKQNDEAELNAVADLMVVLCTGVVEVQDGVAESEWPSLDPDGRDLRINRDLARLLNIDVPDQGKVGRLIIRHLYSPRAHATGKFRGDPALLADGTTVQQWLESGGVRAAENLPGE